MKKIILLSTLSAALLASFGAHAADTTELKVKGVIRPAACTPNFTGGGVVDYGTIAAKDIPADAGKVLEEKAIAFTVTCDAAANVAVRAIDNRQSSVIPGLITNMAAGFSDKYAFGLGVVAGKKVGVYKVKMPQGGFSADGMTPDLITDVAGNKVWQKYGGHLAADGSVRSAFAAAGSNTPLPIKMLSGNIMVQAVLNKGSELPLTQNIDLDGSATIEVQYL